MIKTVFKKWYFVPILVYLIYLIFRISLELYIQPVTLEEGNKTWILNSRSFKLKIYCHYIGGDNEVYEYKILSQPPGLLDEICYSSTDLLLSHPVGMVFGNFDFDSEKELLVLGCEGGPFKSAIPGLVKNINKYYYYQGYYEVMGYYDFQENRFDFKRINDSRFSGIIKDWYIDLFPSGNLLSVVILYGALAILLTGIFALLNLLITKVYQYFYKKKEV